MMVIDGSMVALAGVIGLLGLVPAWMGLVAERRRGGDRLAQGSLAAIAPVDARAAVLAAGRAGYAGVTDIGWERGGWALRVAGMAGRGVRVDGWTGRVTPVGC